MAGDGWSWLFWPQRGGVREHDTPFCRRGFNAGARGEPFSSQVTDIALMTDGLESLALHYASRSPHTPFFAGMFRPLSRATGANEIGHLSSSLESFLSSELVGSRTDDDVSLILATCRPRENLMQFTLRRAPDEHPSRSGAWPRRRRSCLCHLKASRDWVAKIYSAPPDHRKSQKLIAMVEAASQALLKIAAWPDRPIDRS